MDMSNGYELNEKDIESTLGFLRVYDPDNATPEKAIDFLEYLYAGVHRISHTDPDKLEDLYELFRRDTDKRDR